WRCNPEPARFSQIEGVRSIGLFTRLESKANLGLNQAIKRGRTTAASSTETGKSSGAAIGLAEDRGTQVTHRAAQICVIQNICEVNANGQIVAFAGLAAAKAATTATATAASTATTTAATTSAATASTATSGCCGAKASPTSSPSGLSFGVTLAILPTAVLGRGLSLAAETKGFANPKIRND